MAAYAGIRSLLLKNTAVRQQVFCRFCTSKGTDSTVSTDPAREEIVSKPLQELRDRYHGTGISVVQDDGITGITRKEGVTGEVLPSGDDYKSPSTLFKTNVSSKGELLVPRETDIAIIGGGAIGSAVAYFLKQRSPKGFNVHVIERDPCYTQAATVLSVGGIRQQFSLPENIKMSMFTAKFLSNIKEHLSIYGKDPPDIQFNPQGYLFLASEAGMETLTRNVNTQREHGAKIDLMSPKQLKEKFPWMNVDDIAGGSYGIANEGHFDPWLLLTAIRSKAMNLGAEYVKGEVVGFRYKIIRGMTNEGVIADHKRLDSVEVKGPDGKIQPTKFAAVINCAGPWAGEVAKLAGIGIDEGVLKVPLPVEPRKRYVFVIHCPDGPGLEMPMLIDTSGAYVRREGIGGYYICGMSPDPETEPPTDNLDVDYDFFTEHLWPLIAHRIPALECVKLKSAWAGYYDYNYYDQNLIIGNHPYHNNFMMATGCSGHGIQQSPAIGQALMEYILDDAFETIDLKRFMFDRFIEETPIFEDGII